MNEIDTRLEDQLNHITLEYIGVIITHLIEVYPKSTYTLLKLKDCLNKFRKEVGL